MTPEMQACDKCGVDLRYPTAAHIIDCSTIFEKRHGRPKPPSVTSTEWWAYSNRHERVFGIGKDRFSGAWGVMNAQGMAAFPTHAEAIAWAMKEVGVVQGRQERGQRL